MRWTHGLILILLCGLVLAPGGLTSAVAEDPKPEVKPKDKPKDKPGAKAGGKITGTVKGKPKRHLRRGVLVYVEKVKGTFAPPKKHAVMDQKDMKFAPHILPIIVGTTVDFLNSDSVAHNVFSPDHEKYNLGTWPRGQIRSYHFKKTGVYAQLCHVHPEMEGFIVVLQNPHYAFVDKDGKYELSNVPAGTYTLVAWNELMKPARQSVTVKTGQPAKVDFTLKRK